MRVALIHNFYRGVIPSGEDLNVREHQALVGPDVEVVVHSTTNRFVREHPVRGRWQALAAGVDLPLAGRGIAERVLASRPSCVHIENLAPLLPEHLVGELLGRVRVVRRWGNYRFRCPSGNNFRDGADCHECDDLARKVPAVRHGCYAGRRSASVAVAFRPDPLRAGSGMAHVAVSEHVAAQLRVAGVTGDEVTVIPNSVPASTLAGGPPVAAGRDVLYLGSLAQKKGVSELLAAWSGVRSRQPEARLRIIGDGPLRPAVEAAASRDTSITFEGALPYEQGRAALARAHVVVVPSVWDEPFGRVVIEALAEGTPVVAADRGGLPELVGDGTGWLLPSSEVPVLVEGIDRSLSVTDAERRSMGEASLDRYRDHYSVDAVRPLWQTVYEDGR